MSDTGLTDLDQIVQTLNPVVRPGEYVYAVVSPDAAQNMVPRPAAMIVENEGVSVVLLRQDADRAGIAYSFVAAWITISVHSSLEAVGLTAVLAHALSAEGVSCNVLAGFYHDHILVPIEDLDTAMTVLHGLHSRGS